MKILRKQKDNVKLEVESLDDLWYLSHIIEQGDVVSTKSERKIKIGGEDDRKAKVVRKWIFLKLEVEKVEFSKHTNVLRVSGKVVEGPEDVPKGSYHTFNVEENVTLTIEKKEWLKYQWDKLKEASEDTGLKVLIMVHDREEAAFGLLTRRGLETLSSLKGDVAKKGVDEKKNDNFYKNAAKVLLEYDKKHDTSNVVVASPGFWKEYVVPELEEIKKKLVLASCSTVGDKGLQEVIKRPELKQVLEEDRTRKDEIHVENIMEAVSKDNACYGIKECVEKVGIGAVKELMVSDNFILKMRQEDNFKQLDKIMRQTDKMQGSVHIIGSEEPAKKLDSLGGIAGILRWKNS